MEISDRELITATELLKGTGLGLVDAVRLAVELHEELGGETTTPHRARRAIRLASDVLKESEKTVSFAEAVKVCMSSKGHLRPRSIADIRQFLNRMMKAVPSLAARPVRDIKTDECRVLVEQVFTSKRQQFKARVILSGLFSVAYRRGWCSDNPVRRLSPASLIESEIRALNLEEVRSLLTATNDMFKRECRAAVGLMLYAGIRPNEVERLTWDDIDWEENVISIRPSHSKTGGMRHVTIYPVLRKWLEDSPHSKKNRICPPNWRFKWKAVRSGAGWDTSRKRRKPGPMRIRLKKHYSPVDIPEEPKDEEDGIIHWQQDTLRHTFASYHAKHFRDYSALQMEMGHRTPDLLRTRYLNMRGVTAEQARYFWEVDMLCPRHKFPAKRKIRHH